MGFDIRDATRDRERMHVWGRGTASLLLLSVFLASLYSLDLDLFTDEALRMSIGVVSVSTIFFCP